MRIICGEKGADRGSARGPWTVQLSLRPETPAFADVWISRYADPEADGVTPVLRTDCNTSQWLVVGAEFGQSHSQIGLALLEGLFLILSSSVRISLSCLAKTGGSVPPTGGFILLLSVIANEYSRLGIERLSKRIFRQEALKTAATNL